MDAFQRLAVATTLTTYLLILFGALVRATGSGMGCPDWPTCFGLWIPPISADQVPAGFDVSLFNAAKTWTEYLNRLLGAVTGVLILATVVAANRRYRDRPHVLWPAFLALLAVGFEGWLGGVVVAHELAPWIVTAHLLGALVVVGALLYATVHAFVLTPRPFALPTGESARLLVLDAVLLTATLVQIILGTRVRGVLDTAEAAGIAPSSLLQPAAGDDLAHRRLSIVVLVLALAVAWRALRGSGLSSAAKRAAVIIAGVTGAQVGVGVVVAYLGLPPSARVAHVVLASLLFGAQFTLALLLLLTRSNDVEDATQRQRMERNAIL